MPVAKGSPFSNGSQCFGIGDQDKQACLAQTVDEDQALDAAIPGVGSKTKLKN